MKHEPIIKMNQDLMMFFEEIICLKNEAYIINLDEYPDVNIHWIALFCDRMKLVYFDSFSVEHVPEEIKKFIRDENIMANFFWVQANNSVMCDYFCIGFIDFKLADKKIDWFYKFVFSHDFKRNGDVILWYFKNEVK